MPLISARTRRKIGNIIDSEYEQNLDDKTLSKELDMLEKLNERNELDISEIAKYNYLSQVYKERNERNDVWKDVKSPRKRKSKRKTSFGKNKSKTFFKHLPVNIENEKLKRFHTIGGKRKTSKNRT